MHKTKSGWLHATPAVIAYVDSFMIIHDSRMGFSGICQINSSDSLSSDGMLLLLERRQEIFDASDCHISTACLMVNIYCKAINQALLSVECYEKYLRKCISPYFPLLSNIIMQGGILRKCFSTVFQ